MVIILSNLLKALRLSCATQSILSNLVLKTSNGLYITQDDLYKVHNFINRLQHETDKLDTYYLNQST